MAEGVLDVLVNEVRALLGTVEQEVDVAPLIEALTCSDLSGTQVAAQIPAHDTFLDQALSIIPDHPFNNLKTALIAAKDHLHWKVDEGGYYAPGDDVGQGYRQGNLHSLLLGPANAPIHHDNALIGFFLLAPYTLYRDHAHLAPELYIPLTGLNGWRFGQSEWMDLPAGQVIFNPPEKVHATRVYDVPFLALFAWTRDINHLCRVVPAGDWGEIEASLAKAKRQTKNAAP